MNRSNLTVVVKSALNSDNRTHFNQVYLYFQVCERHGLTLTEAQKSCISDLPNPDSVMRIGRSELKARQKQKRLSK